MNEKVERITFGMDMRAVEGLHRYLSSTVEYYDQNDPYIEDIRKIIATLQNIKESNDKHDKE